MPRRAKKRRAREAAARVAAPDTAMQTPGAPGECPVVGCPNVGMCRHDTPSGPIYLCGRCDIVARRNLRDKQGHEELLEALAAPLQRSALVRQKAAARIYSPS
jgi:hypothetical protein